MATEYEDERSSSLLLLIGALTVVLVIAALSLEQKRACERQTCLGGLPQLVDGECLCLQELP